MKLSDGYYWLHTGPWPVSSSATGRVQWRYERDGEQLVPDVNNEMHSTVFLDLLVAEGYRTEDVAGSSE